MSRSGHRLGRRDETCCRVDFRLRRLGNQGWFLRLRPRWIGAGEAQKRQIGRNFRLTCPAGKTIARAGNPGKDPEVSGPAQLAAMNLAAEPPRGMTMKPPWTLMTVSPDATPVGLSPRWEVMR